MELDHAPCAEEERASNSSHSEFSFEEESVVMHLDTDGEPWDGLEAHKIPPFEVLGKLKGLGWFEDLISRKHDAPWGSLDLRNDYSQPASSRATSVFSDQDNAAFETLSKMRDFSPPLLVQGALSPVNEMRGSLVHGTPVLPYAYGEEPHTTASQPEDAFTCTSVDMYLPYLCAQTATASDNYLEAPLPVHLQDFDMDLSWDTLKGDTLGLTNSFEPLRPPRNGYEYLHSVGQSGYISLAGILGQVGPIRDRRCR
ncbi:hypothetical protein EJ02DRAFT_512632 [Clathrospora elynae]|uniref:Uncharacterized protein n=1 Tax=Clathrospora elynae TaxID=706981 RepID=A0A6A5SMT0_9PLEO|nr:hypothetical protein EJ02DRAFT_512632 [Clathrospora elynae]